MLWQGSPSSPCRILLARYPLFRSVADLYGSHQRLNVALYYKVVGASKKFPKDFSADS